MNLAGAKGKVVVNFTPTGMIPQKKEAPSVPIDTHEIVEQVHAAYELGISLVHLHARKSDGTPSSEAADFAPILEGVRLHCPDLVMCASLSGRDVQDPILRSEVLSLKPDMASLTLSSLNFVKSASVNSPETIQVLADRIADSGGRPEFEVFDVGMVNYLQYLISKGRVSPPFYINLLVGNIAGAQLSAAHLAALERDLPQGAILALAGLGRFQLDAHMVAMGLGWGIRVGLEDNIYWDRERTRPTTNHDLLQRTHDLVALAGREVMTASDFGALGFYNRYRHAS